MVSGYTESYWYRYVYRSVHSYRPSRLLRNLMAILAWFAKHQVEHGSFVYYEDTWTYREDFSPINAGNISSKLPIRVVLNVSVEVCQVSVTYLFSFGMFFHYDCVLNSRPSSEPLSIRVLHQA